MSVSSSSSVVATAAPAGYEPPSASAPLVVLTDLLPRSRAVSESSLPICRICRCGAEAATPLFSPCLCTGSAAFVHLPCLQRWIEQRPAADPSSSQHSMDSAAATTPPSPSSSSSFSPSSAPFPDAALTCELCHGQYAVSFEQRHRLWTCGRHLLRPCMDVLVHSLFLALFVLAILQFPVSDLPAFRPVAVVVLTVFTALSLGLNAQRWPRPAPLLVLTSLVPAPVKASISFSASGKSDLSERLMPHDDLEKAERYSGESRSSPSHQHSAARAQ